MAKTWILESETKGTGAHMVPLEDVLTEPRVERDLSVVRLKRTPHAAKPSSPPEPLRFKVVDVLSARVLAEGVDAREAVEALEQLRSVIDARVSVWMPKTGRWRLLGLDEQKALWRFRGHAARSTA